VKQAMVRGDVQRPRAAQEWAVTVREWRRSGLKASAFCRERGLTLKTFEWWRWSLHARRPRAGASRLMDRLLSSAPPASVGPARIAPAFVEVLPKSPPALQETPWEDLAGVEVVLRGDRRVRVEKGFDGATLRRVVAILEEA
jgi:hypothetical protein